LRTEPGISRRLNSLAAAALTVIIGSGAFVLPSRLKAEDPIDRLALLYKECRYFELRDTLSEMKANPSLALDFFRGATANIFNRLDAAIISLLRYLDGASPNSPLPLTKEAWGLLADSYRRSGQYRKSAEAQRLILSRFEAELDAFEKDNRRNQDVIWSSLADVPAPTIEMSRGSIIQLENRHFPVRIKDRVFYCVYDTGANLSVLYQSAANELGLALHGPGIKIQSGTGKWIDGRMAVVPEMRLGEAIVRNAVFLVLPDDYFHVWHVRAGVERRGIIGVPILTAFKELTETRDGRLLIPARPSPRSVQNMGFYGFMPIVEVLHRGARLSFSLDTGSSATFLHPPFFRRYRGEIEARSKLRTITMGGVGDARAVKIHILDEFAFKAGGMDIALKKIEVHTEVTHSSTKLLFGTLGLDILGQCSQMTFNFESMSFVLE